jgi:hypothetical protein
MTIDQDLVARRWAAADADAERVLADERWFLQGSRAVRVSITIALVALVGVGVGFFVTPRGNGQHAGPVVAVVVVALSLASTVWVTITDYRRRRFRGQAYPTVTSMLSARERHAIARVASGRGTAPDDRARVVRAAALLRTDARRVDQALWLAVLWAAVALGALSEDAPLAVMYFVAGALTLIRAGWTWFDVARVRRFLRERPLS